MTEKTAYRKKP